MAKKMGDPQYIPKFIAYLERPHMAQVVSQYLASIDLRKYTTGVDGAHRVTFQSTRPFSEYYKDCRTLNLAPLPRFASALINSKYGVPVDGIVEIDSKKFLQEFIAYDETSNNDAKKRPNAQTVGRDIKKFKSIVPHRYSAKMTYRIDFTKLKEELDEMNQYDINAYL